MDGEICQALNHNHNLALWTAFKTSVKNDGKTWLHPFGFTPYLQYVFIFLFMSNYDVTHFYILPRNPLHPNPFPTSKRKNNCVFCCCVLLQNLNTSSNLSTRTNHKTSSAKWPATTVFTSSLNDPPIKITVDVLLLLSPQQQQQQQQTWIPFKKKGRQIPQILPYICMFLQGNLSI